MPGLYSYRLRLLAIPDHIILSVFKQWNSCLACVMQGYSTAWLLSCSVEPTEPVVKTSHCNCQVFCSSDLDSRIVQSHAQQAPNCACTSLGLRHTTFLPTFCSNACWYKHVHICSYMSCCWALSIVFKWLAPTVSYVPIHCCRSYHYTFCYYSYIAVN